VWEQVLLHLWSQMSGLDDDEAEMLQRRLAELYGSPPPQRPPEPAREPDETPAEGPTSPDGSRPASSVGGCLVLGMALVGGVLFLAIALFG